MKEKLKKIFSKKEYIVFLVALIITLASLSYAFFLSTDMFNNNIATTDCFKLTLNDSNDIHLEKTYPLSESEGSNLTPYQFTIKNVCKVSADYQVNIETLNTSTLDTEYLRIKLDNNESSILKRYELNTNNVNNNVLEGRNITTGTLRANEERTYSLRMWIDENATTEQSSNKEYYGKVTVQATPNKEVNDIEIAYIVDGAPQDAPPAKGDGYIIKSVTCENADGIWLSDEWSFKASNITGRVKCNLEFEEAVYNNVPKWLATANIDKNYTTLNEVFNDSDTLDTLTSNESSCDYLVNSTEWVSDITSNEAAMTYIGNNDYCGDKIFFDDNWDDTIANSTYWDKILKPLVPTMTSNTSPRGEVFTYYGDTRAVYEPWHAFDGNDSTGTAWQMHTPITDVGVGYSFGYKVKMAKYMVSAGTLDRINSFKIKGSNNKVEWDEIATVTYPGEYNIIVSCNPSSTYLHIALFQESLNNHSGSISVRVIQFYGRAVDQNN